MLKRRRWIIVGVLVVVLACIGLSVLRWGEMVYWRSGGERGWNLGETAYRLLGWGSDAYHSDFGQGQAESEAPGGFAPPGHFGRGQFGPGRWGSGHMMPFGHMSGPFRLAGGLICLPLLAAVIVVVGIVLYRRRRRAQRPAAAPTPPA